MLTDLITRYLEAQRVWEAQFESDCDKSDASPEWEAYLRLSGDIIDYRCATMPEIRRRAEFILSEEHLVDILANCSTDAAVRHFLKSMTAAPEVVPIDESGMSAGFGIVDIGEK